MNCRLWYWKCPKYEQYHYASQFIYSKAEKGKVLREFIFPFLLVENATLIGRI